MTNPNSRKKTTARASAKPKPTKEVQQPDDQPLETIEVKVHEVTAVEVISGVTSEELTQEEQRLRLSLERKVEHAFYEAGKALKELRDRRLYRSTHKTFEEYCRDRFGYSRRQPYLLMDAAVVFENLKAKCDPMDHILPTSERQVRPMIQLEPEEQEKVWKQAVQEAGGKVPSGRIVQSVVDRIRERTKIPNPYRIGEICVLVPKDNPDLRGKGGCWGVITHVGDFSCTVETWDGEYTVKVEHLKSLELLDDDCSFLQQLCLRLRRLHQVANHDPAVDWLLQGLGKQASPYLSGLQAKLLAVVEREYKIEWKQQR